MTRSRVPSVLLALVMIVSLFSFCVSAEAETVDLSLSFSGSGAIVFSGRTYTDEITIPVSQGASVSLTAEPDEDFEFLFWVNKETDRVVSREQTYSFVAATYAKVEAVFDVTEAVARADDMHTVVYLTEGENIRYFETVSMGDEDYYQYVPQNGLMVGGKTFLGWDKTPAEVARTDGRVYVRPLYDSDVSYVITTFVNGVKAEAQVKYRDTTTIVAPQTLNGESFSYWIARYGDENRPDAVASYYASYSFVVTSDATFEAVYGEEVTTGIATRISGDSPNFSASAISIHAEHSVTQDYTIIQHGLIFTREATVGSFEDLFIINPNDSRIKKGTSNNTLLAGTYSVTVSKWFAQNTDGGYYYPQLFARAYVIALDKSGAQVTVYSPIYVIDYQDTAFGGTDVDDPFG